MNNNKINEILKKNKKYSFNDLISVMEILRSESGCPWDKKQTHESLKSSTIEEAYEVIEAINNSDMSNLREELGDLLLHVVFHSKIAEDNKEFQIEDVINEVVEKLIRRHPHVFGSETVNSSSEVIEKWEDIKKTEKKYHSESEMLESVPKAMPALVRAYKVQKKAADVGFDFDNWGQAYKKIYEELKEFEEAIEQRNNDKIMDEYGDILFSFVNISRFLEINPEICLTNAIEKFINRFKGIELLANERNIELKRMSIKEMDLLWEEVKRVSNNH